MKVIITGATGMVGEGGLFECLENPQIEEILIINRKKCDLNHSKLKELLVPDFTNLGAEAQNLTGYDACFYCAGISSAGMSEEDYTKVTYNTTISYPKTSLTLKQVGQAMVNTIQKSFPK